MILDMQATYKQNLGKWMHAHRRKIVIWLVLLLILLLVGFLAFRAIEFGVEHVVFALFPDGRGDWKYPLPNDYWVLRSNSGHISISQKNGDSIYLTCIESYIFGFCYNSRYIGAMRINTQENMITDDEQKIQEYEYYLLDTENGMCGGPYSESELWDQCAARNVDDLCDWIYTKDISCYNVPSFGNENS